MQDKKHGGDIYSYMLHNNKPPLDFSANVNPLGLPKQVKKALKKSVDTFVPYPDTDCRMLRNRLSLYENVEEQNIVCGCGAADLIFRIVRTLKPQHALLAAPCFSEYAQALEDEGCAIEYFYLRQANNFKVDEVFVEFIQEPVRIIFLCSPNNPTGQVVPYDVLEKILRKAASIGCYVVLDECFIDFVNEDERCSGNNLLFEFDNLIILKAFTKNFAMAGLRLGYVLCSNLELLGRVAKCGQPWSVSTPAQVAGYAALNADKYLETTLKNTKKERKYLQDALAEMPVVVYKSQSNFILFKLKEELDLSALLYEKGILIRSCANFTGLNELFYRIAVKNHKENKKLVRALREIWGGNKNG